MKRKFSIINRILAALIVVALIVGVVAARNSIKANALFNADKAITFKEYNAKNYIPAGTRFMGTYLVDATAMTDEIYDVIQKSINSSQQYNNFYKSEVLDANTWFDIESAEDLTSISTKGNPVSESDMAGLFITRVIDSNGIVRDAKTGEIVSLFDDPDPYDLWSMDELQGITVLVGSVYQCNESDISDYYYHLFKDFLDSDIKDSESATYDRMLINLQNAYVALASSNNPQDVERAEIVTEVMKSVDGARRAHILNKLIENDDEYLSKVATDVMKPTKDNHNKKPAPKWSDTFFGALAAAQDDDKEDLMDDAEDNGLNIKETDEANSPQSAEPAPDATAVSAVAEAQNNILKSITTYESYALVSPEQDADSLSVAIYRRALAVSEGNNVNNNIDELQRLYHIRDGQVSEREEELSLLEGELIPDSSSRYGSSITAGVDIQAITALGQGSSAAGEEAAIEQQYGKTEGVRTELQNMISAKILRVTKEDAVYYLIDRINWSQNTSDSIPNDHYTDKAKLSINAHIKWLQDTLANIINSDDDLKSKLQDLMDQKQNALDQKLGCLDNNDLAGAARIDSLIEELDKEIAEETAKMAEKAGDDPTAKASLDGTPTGTLNKIADNFINSLNEGGDGGNQLDALVALDAKDQIEDLKDKLGDLDSLNKASDAIDKNRDEAGKNLKKLDKDSLLSMLDGPFESLDEEGKIIAAVTFGWFGEEGYDASAQLAINLMNICVKENNRFAYKSVNQGNVECVNLYAIDRASKTKYRYVYDDSRSEAKMNYVASDEVKMFKVGSANVDIGTSKKTTMENVATFKYDYVYINENDCKKLFEMEAEPVKNSGYSGVFTSSMEKKAQTLLKKIEKELAKKDTD